MDEPEAERWSEEYGYLAVYVWAWAFISRQPGRKKWMPYPLIRSEYRRLFGGPVVVLLSILSNLRQNWQVIEKRGKGESATFRAEIPFGPEHRQAQAAHVLARVRWSILAVLPQPDEPFLAKPSIYKRLEEHDASLFGDIARYTNQRTGPKAVSVMLGAMQRSQLVESELRDGHSWWRLSKPAPRATKGQQGRAYVETVDRAAILSLLTSTPAGVSEARILAFLFESRKIKPTVRRLRSELRYMAEWQLIGAYPIIPGHKFLIGRALLRWYAIEHLPMSADEYQEAVQQLAKALTTFLRDHAPTRYTLPALITAMRIPQQELLARFKPKSAEYSGPYQRQAIIYALQMAIKQQEVAIGGRGTRSEYYALVEDLS